MKSSSIGVYHITVDMQQQKVTVIGSVDPNNLVKKLNKTGKHAEVWPEPVNQNPPSGGGGKKSKKKKKNNNNNPTEPQKQNENSEQPQASSDDESSPEEHSEKPDQDKENDQKEKPEGGAVTIIQNPTFTPNPPPQIIQVGTGPGTGGKKKKKKKKNNNSSSNNNNNNNNGNMNSGSNGGGGEGTELTAHEMPVNAIVSHGFVGAGAGAGPGGHLDSIGYPGSTVPHIPSYVVNYSVVQPSTSFGGSYHHNPTEVAPPAGTGYNGGCFSPPAVVTTVPAGGGSYYMFSEENANACVVM